MEMKPYLGAFAMAAPLLVAVVGAPALAQKSGGILKMYSPDRQPGEMGTKRRKGFGSVRSRHVTTACSSSAIALFTVSNIIVRDQGVRFATDSPVERGGFEP